MGQLKTALVISRSFPHDLDRCTGGIYQRLRLLVQGVASKFTRIRVLFFAAPEIAENHSGVKLACAALCQQWGLALDIRVVPWDSRATPADFYSYYVKPIYSVDDQSNFRHLASTRILNELSSELDRYPDVILAHRLQMMHLLVKLRRPLPRVITDLDDVDHKFLIRSSLSSGAWAGQRLNLLQVPALLLAERAAIDRSTLALVCSKTDQTHLRRIFHSDKVRVLENSVVFPEASSKRNAPCPTILFVGSYGYMPNRDAAQYLIGCIFPLVIAAVPSARLLLVGEQPESIDTKNANLQGVEFRGFAKSLAEVYNESTIVCSPLRIGSGTRLKILEAAGYGMPIVSTHLGAEGLEFNSGTEILLCETAEQIASNCVQLLSDAAKAAQLGSAARRRIINSYDRSRLVEKLGDMLTIGQE